MARTYCVMCGHTKGYKRVFGWGTILALIGTAGLWLACLPFYPQRCVVCGWKRQLQ